MSEDDGIPFDELAADLHDLDPPRAHARLISEFHRSMVPKDSVDEFVSIDTVCQAASGSVFEYAPDDGFRLERLYFDEPIRGVMLKMGVKRPPSFDFTSPGKTKDRSSEMTRHLPMSWFAGVGKDGMLGQPLTIFKGMSIGERFIIEFHNHGTASVHLLGVLAGKHLAHKR